MKESLRMPEEIKNEFYNIIEKNYRKGDQYDYLVLFSGGKDSSYLAHKLIEIGKRDRVCLLSIDNAMENDDFFPYARKIADKLKCDLYTYHMPEEHFIKFYKFLITEPSLTAIEDNPLCFLCGRYFMSLGVEFASRNRIPVVLYGATPEQINKGQRAETLRSIALFSMISKKLMNETHEKLKQLDNYQSDETLRGIIDKIFVLPEDVSLVFPFQYLDYDIEEVKTALINAYQWENPNPDLDNSQYLSTGCRLVNLFGVLNRKTSIKSHELTQFKKDFDNGLMSKETYEYTRDQFVEIMKGEVTDEVLELADKIGISDLILDNQ